MTPDELRDEGAEDPIEDLQAPAETLLDVAGGAHVCTQPTCHGNTDYMGYCLGPTCSATKLDCVSAGSRTIIVHEA
jgi:hypothetical protein